MLHADCIQSQWRDTSEREQMQIVPGGTNEVKARTRKLKVFQLEQTILADLWLMNVHQGANPNHEEQTQTTPISTHFWHSFCYLVVYLYDTLMNKWTNTGWNLEIFLFWTAA